MIRRLLRPGLVPVVLVASLLTPGCGTAGQGHGNSPTARGVLIDAKQLPSGYRLAEGPDDLGDLEVCGVRLRPGNVRDFASERYTKTAAGPFLYQYVFLTKDHAAQELLTKLEDSLASCAADTVTSDEGEEITFDVTRLGDLPTYGRRSVGFRLDPHPGGIPSEYLAIQYPDAFVLLVTISGVGQPPRGLLRAGADAVTAKMS